MAKSEPRIAAVGMYLSAAERSLRARLGTAGVPAILWTTDTDLRFTMSSGAALASLNLVPGQAIGISLWDYFDTRDENDVHIAAHLRALRGESVAFETVWQKRAFDVQVDPLRSATGAIVGTVGVAIDQTTRQGTSEHGLLLAQLRQQQKLEAIGTLASGVAHEINNPVQSIMNYAQLIRRRAAMPEIDDYASEILNEAQRVAAIVRDLLSFARQEGEPYAEVQVGAIITSTLALISAMLRKEGVRVVVEIAEGLPPVRCHPQQIQQVLMNLLTNARDALNERYPEGGEAKRIFIAAAQHVDERARTWLRITVEDSGTGIAPDMLEKIFDPFSTTKHNAGPGLGLAVSQGIAREHGGALHVESELGDFARFHLDLPLAQGT